MNWCLVLLMRPLGLCLLNSVSCLGDELNKDFVIMNYMVLSGGQEE